MAGYHRFVAYVHEYRRGEKGTNVGFICVQIQKHCCRMEVNLRCMGLLANVECKIYGFLREKESLKGILFGKCRTKEHQIQACLEFNARNVMESGKSVGDFSGIYLVTQEGARFASAWDNWPIQLEQLKLEGEEAKLQRKEQSNKRTEEEDHQKEERQEEFLQRDTEFVKCWKVRPCSMEAVFQTNPFLKGNRFILHGCSNYGHLLMARKKDGQFILGVPGNFDQQECFMAGIFGFPHFKESQRLRLHKNGGYWYRSINPPDLDMRNGCEEEILEVLEL